MTDRQFSRLGFLIIGIFLIVISTIGIVQRHIYEKDIDTRAIDTVNVGTGPNTGTGDPLRTAFLKINEAIKIIDSLDLELLTNDEVQALKDVEDLADGLLFPASDTTVTAEVGKIVYKSSNKKWYGCVRATPTTRWEALN